jgi:prolyl-tRNA editing enzyme YbaK/EbsC (Cys-tRNA(Pro) deacylase)
MHPNAERVREALAGAGARADVVEFPEATRTSADAAAAIGTTIAQIAKTLVFLADGEPVLVIASGPDRVSEERLGEHLGATISRADAEAVRDATGFPIGGVPPVGHSRRLRVVIDAALLEHEEIWSAGGTPNAVFPTTPAELIRLTGGEVVDVRA